MILKKHCFIFFALLALLLFSRPVFGQDASRVVYLTGAEFQTLLSIIQQSKTNSEAQRALIAELKADLQAQEGALKAALNALELSEAALIELTDTLAKIQDYSAKLSAYCKTLEGENRTLKTRNKTLAFGCGGLGGALCIALLIILL